MVVQCQVNKGFARVNDSGSGLNQRADLLLAPGVQELDAANGRSSVPLVSFDHVLDAQRGTGTSVDISKHIF